MSEIAQSFRFYKNLNHLEQKGSIMAEYVWIDGSDVTLRAKARTLTKEIKSISDIPDWNYDGSSCYQASTLNSEVIMKPVAYFPDPFRPHEGNIIVLCESFVWANEQFTQLKPANTNFRHFAKKIFEAGASHEPWFGIEQEYSVLEHKTKFTTKPLGWPESGYPGPQGPYYCSVEVSWILTTEHACMLVLRFQVLTAKLCQVNGNINLGPCLGIEIADHLWLSRYLLSRVSEDFNITITLEPKLFKDFNGAGAHINFSDKIMREGTQGMDHVNKVVAKLAENICFILSNKKHKIHLDVYGDNSKRLTGHHETSSKEHFSSGVGDRAASVRIPPFTARDDGKGYIEDRRPASDIDPYVAVAAIVDTVCNNGEQFGELYSAYMEWKEWRKTADIEEA